MKLSDLRLRQRDSTTCGPSVAVVAGALVDPDYRAALTESPRSWFDDEQLRVHTEVNRVWPRMLGTTPDGRRPRAHHANRVARRPLPVEAVPRPARPAVRRAVLRAGRVARRDVGRPVHTEALGVDRRCRRADAAVL